MKAEYYKIWLKSDATLSLTAPSRTLPPIAEPTIPMTIKIPQDIALKIRTYAHTHNLTIGDLITHSVLAYLASESYHG